MPDVICNSDKVGCSVAKYQRCDVTDWDDQVSLFELAQRAFGSVDVVVRYLYHTNELKLVLTFEFNQIPNAGVTESSRVFEVAFKDGKPQAPNLKTIQVNVNSVLYSTCFSAQECFL